MIFRRPRRFLFLICLAMPSALLAQTPAQPASSSSAKSPSARPVKKPAAPLDSALDAGAVTDGLYRNKTLALSYKIPLAWVLRTDELNAREVENEEKDQSVAAQPSAPSASSAGAKVLLAAFSRPPEAKGEDVNSSILIAAESASSYPGLSDAVQYFGPLTEVTRAQGFIPDEDPYEIAVGPRTLVRADFHKDVGTRVMHQSTLAMLSHGYAISITVIAGTDDEVEELIDALTFTATAK